MFRLCLPSLVAVSLVVVLVEGQTWTDDTPSDYSDGADDPKDTFLGEPRSVSKVDVEQAADFLAAQFTNFYFMWPGPSVRFVQRKISGVSCQNSGHNFVILTLDVLISTDRPYTEPPNHHPPLYLNCRRARVKRRTDGFMSVLSAPCTERFA